MSCLKYTAYLSFASLYIWPQVYSFIHIFFLISRLNVDKAGVELMEEEIYWVKQSLSPRTLPGVL